MTSKQFEKEIRQTLERFGRLVAADAGLLEVKRHWRREHTVRSYTVRGHWVRRIGKAA